MPSIPSRTLPKGLLPIINPDIEKKDIVEKSIRSPRKLGRPKRIGRPRKSKARKIDAKQLYLMSQTLLNMDSIALILGISIDSLKRNYSHIVAEARENRKCTLLQKMWSNALDKNSEKMQIWLSKQYLGHKESWPEQGMPVAINIQINEVP